MDRRDFITSILAGGMLGISSWSVRAAALGGDAQGPVNIVLQGDLPQAVGLGDGLRRALGVAGLAQRVTTLTSGDLASCEAVSALLRANPGATVLGVMDDASALIFQALAAARGSATLAQAHHRFAADRAGLCCDAAGLAARLRWEDAMPLHAQRIGRLYATLLGGAPAAPDSLSPPTDVNAAFGTPASLVSFLITT